MKMEKNGNSIVVDSNTLSYNDRVIFDWSVDPVAFIGRGEEEVEMYRGNFKIEDYLITRIPLDKVDYTEADDQIKLSLSCGDSKAALVIIAKFDDLGRLVLALEGDDKSYNRLWLRLAANSDEKVYGCGEQLSHFNLRGKHFPLWSSEPGVGRNKETLTTFWADVKDKAGGNYYTTNYPEATFVSTEKYYCHTNSYAYADFDFRNDHFHELQYWEIPDSLVFETAPTYKKLIEKLTGLLGRQPQLPEWSDNGFLLGIQGGTDYVYNTGKKLIDKGVKLAGFWCQDWEGIRMTSFGKRLFWNWEWNGELYPELDKKIHEWKENENLRFMTYINPYVAIDAKMYPEADAKGYFAKNKDGGTYQVDFGEFNCGVVDFTNPEAFDWFKNVIKTELIDFGCDGWMADFGEYLPTDVVLHDGTDPMVAHNKWPMLWAKCNYDAVQESGKWGEIVYFMRAGATGSQKYCPLIWAGDQSVNWSLDDGLASTIPAALSVGMSGCGLSHSDIGGYTSLHGNIRTKELFMRWAEMGAFLPFMRSHEGNRPAENFQVFDDDEAIDHLAICTNVFTDLTDYRRAIVKENSEKGTPVQRPLFMEYEDDQHAYDIQYQYLFGPDVMVAPVHEEGKSEWDVYLPEDTWVHLWTGKEFKGGNYTVASPIGQTPVFYRKGSEYAELFESITSKYK
ncbi:alpha-glucosidase [Enterococcus gilvus]|uniref:Alpha-glucosidase n=1 Tax=Enterococcus gilvus ATCC BAA-350 TaxID=1158614 RepID=R2XZF3_9ENTE|nr:alpha-glucosidase [Enterococcus gilvus]EOI55422.1 hypothetical protein UKC_02630 [Enterococcus gilvus ATCC BAA-350]EOW82035.1 hypothetical protein I592_01336 [Enterococcus gilvus ATCC BAA-350]OJG43064.1 hypothetical protein RV02_GL002984 [Enterococcus gilvus]